MLFIARADHDESPLQAQAVDLAAEAHRVADYLSLIADEKGVPIRVLGQAPAFPADPLLVQRAITNLLSNAIRHAPQHSTVTIEVGSAGGQATLAVSNDGEGIAPAHIDRVFDRFFRADPARSRDAGGSGLGLAIVRSIVQAHRGSAAVRSQAGRTTFTLSFPLAEGAQGAAASRPGGVGDQG
jgi:two-component system heavy metal sensor histidine kinase CusS